MNEFDNWLKSADDWIQSQSGPDSDSIITGTRERVRKRLSRRRQGRVGLGAVAAMLLVFIISAQLRSPQISTPASRTLGQETLFDGSLMPGLLDSTDLNKLYWASVEYLLNSPDMTDPLPELLLSSADLTAFKSFMEDKNS